MPSTTAEVEATTTVSDADPPSDTECVVPTARGKSEGCLFYDGLKRAYLLQIPASLDPTVPAPLVMFFHGGSGNMSGVLRTGIFREARDRGWLAVSPQGADVGQPAENGFTWNAVHCCGESFQNDVDDVGFVRSLVSELEGVLPIDPARIYVAGFSNGAMFTHRVGSELSDIIAAIAPSSGTIGGSRVESGQMVTIDAPPRPLPIMLMHGVKDTTVPIGGGFGKRKRFDLSFRDSVAFWVKANGCDPEPTTTEEDWGTHNLFSGCEANGDVVANTYSELGHAFPTIEKGAGTDGAIQVMDFFAAQRLPGE